MSAVKLEWMQPRNHRVGTRVVMWLTGVALAVTLVFLPFTPNQVGVSKPELVAQCGIAVVCLALLVGAAWIFNGAPNRLAWAASPFLAITLIVVVDLATSDASFAAQIFLLFPALYAATLLPRQGVALVTAASLVGEFVVVLSHLPTRDAIIDAGYMTAALVTTSILLTRAAERQVTLTAELVRRAGTDSLTGLVNRRVFDKATLAALTHADRDGGTALVMLDVDHFKLVNDRFGHPAGDQVLVQISDLLVEASRHGDVVCRLGGDEMALLMPNCSVEVAHRRAEEIVESIRTHRFALAAGQVASVSVSAGLAHDPTDADDPAGLYAAADAALYEAKRTGRDRAVSHTLLEASLQRGRQPSTGEKRPA